MRTANSCFTNCHHPISFNLSVYFALPEVMLVTIILLDYSERIWNLIIKRYLQLYIIVTIKFQLILSYNYMIVRTVARTHTYFDIYNEINYLQLKSSLVDILNCNSTRRDISSREIQYYTKSHYYQTML